MGMILEKKLQTPSYVRRTVQREISLFREQGNALLAEGIHFREKDGRIVQAEGREAEGTLPENTTALFRTVGMDDALFAYSDADETLYDLKQQKSYALSLRPKQIVCFREGEEKRYYVLTQSSFSRLKTLTENEEGAEGETVETTAVIAVRTSGGDCCGVHYERVFIADGESVAYSAPLTAEDWTIAIDKAGKIDLPNECGNIHAIVSFDDRLYLFRERGITRLYASGDMLGFRAEAIPYACGMMKQGSVVNCGRYVCFLTESGLFSFNGQVCMRISHCGSEAIDAESEISAAFANGKYYATVTVGGERCIFCYDPEQERGHFIRFSADCIVGGVRLLFAQGGKLYHLTDRGTGEKGSELYLGKTTFFTSSKDKMLDAIVIDGNGYFRVEIRSGKGLARFVRGWAGEYLRLPYPIRGAAFSLRLRTNSENCFVRAVTLDFREAQK